MNESRVIEVDGSLQNTLIRWKKLILLSRLGVELTQGYFWGSPVEFGLLPPVSEYADKFEKLASKGLFGNEQGVIYGIT